MEEIYVPVLTSRGQRVYNRGGECLSTPPAKIGRRYDNVRLGEVMTMGSGIVSNHMVLLKRLCRN